ncbi:MAG: hypothetical protein KBG48_11175 [Kofleriaceae bacterium]|nr:hypothetical protein [Kofleriaceae bacterium]MBP9167945.1 hypothetical protein [Kofleriaceae bacterium]MBP9856779.1 hypothetical protein [Kofleriaceae bacterium]
MPDAASLHLSSSSRARRPWRSPGRRWSLPLVAAALIEAVVVPPGRAWAALPAPLELAQHRAGGSASPPLVSSDGQTGDATFAHDLALPPGRDGLTPRLGLHYRSSGGNSDVGRGWSLVGVSWIERDTRVAAPKLSSADRFVLRTPTSTQTLVRIGTLSGFAASGVAFEYRLADDSDDLQFIFLEASNQWRIRARTGEDQFFQAAVVHSPGAPPSWLPGTTAPVGTAAQTLAWNLTRTRDANGNTIDYRYDVPTRLGNHVNASGPIQGRHAETPRLVEIQYGGNDGSQVAAAAMPHLFRISLARHGMTTPAVLAAHAPPARDPACYPTNDGVVGGRYEAVSLRAGGALHDTGEGVAVWGIAVEAVAPGTTDGAQREFASRLASVTRLTYNLDEVGCGNADELHPTLKRIDTYGVAEDGTLTEAPPLTFHYYGWDRRFVATDLAMPAVHRYDAPNLDTWLWRGFGATITAEQRGQLQLGLGGAGRASASGLFRTSAAVEQAFADLDGDTVPDFVDHGRSAACYPGESFATGAWIRGSAGGWLDPPAALPFGPVERRGGAKICGTTTFEAATVHCTVDYDHRAGFPYAHADRLDLDLDSDGYADLLEASDEFDPARPLWHPYQSWPTGARWTWRRNTLADTGVVGYGAAQPLPVFPWVLPTTLVNGAAVAAQGFYGAATMDGRRFNMFDDDGCHGPGNPEVNGSYGWNVDGPMQRLVNDGRRVLVGNYSEHAQRMTASGSPLGEDTVAYSQATTDSRAGSLLDITGDGLLDRVVATSFVDQRFAAGDLRRNSDGALVVYRGTGPGQFGPAELWALPGVTAAARAREARYPLVTHRTMTLSARRDLLPARRTFTTDAVTDVNGDGLPDLLTVRPDVETHTGAVATRFEPMTWMLNHRLGLAGWGGGRSGAALPQAISQDDLDAIATDTQARRSRTRYQLFDYNGDGLPDFVGEGWIQYGTGAGFTAPLELAAAAIGLDDPFRPGLAFTERAWHEAGSQVVRPERVILDVTGDGRPELIVHDEYSGDGAARVYTDADPGAAPGRLRVVDNGRGARTELRYQTQVAALAPGDRAVPIKRWVLASSQTTDGSARVLTTQYRYAGPVLKKTSELVGGQPLTPAAGFHGFRRVAVCHPDGTQTETHHDFAGRLDGRVAKVTQFGDDPSTDKCEFIDDESPGGRIRARTSYEYESSSLPAAGGAEVVTQLRPRRTVATTFLPGQSLTSTRESVTTWSQVNGRWVATATVSRSVPEVPAETISTRVSYAANLRTSASSYRVVTTERATSGPTYGDVERTRYFYDGSTTFGGFTRGNLTRVQRFTGATTSVNTDLTLDALGHVVTERSPLGFLSRTCWDGKGLYPVAQQDPAGLVTTHVTAYATGQVLEQAGPIGYPSTALSCAAAASSGGLSSRVTPAAPPWKFKRALQPSTTTSHPTVALLPSDAASSTAGSASRYWASLSAGWAPMERVVAGLEPIIPRPYVGLAVGGAAMASGTLGAAPPAWFSDAPPTTAVPTTRYRYDGLGRLLATYGPRGRGTDGRFAIGQRTLAEHNQPGTLSQQWVGLDDAAVIDKLRAPQVETAVDGLGRTQYRARIVERTAAAPWGRYVTTSFGYDLAGRPWTACGPTPDDAGDCAEVVARDNLGAVLAVRAAGGATSSVSYGFEPAGAAVRLVATSTAPTGETTTQLYDSLGRLVATRQASGLGGTVTTAQEYDAAGRVRVATDGLGAVIATSYDLAGRTTSVRRYAARAVLDLGQPPLRGQTSTYDSDGKVLTTVETAIGEASRTTTLGYDTKGRLRTVTPPAAPGLPNHGVTTYVYDDVTTSNGYGRVVRVSSPAEDLDLTYDGRGLMVREKRSYHVALGGRVLSDALEVGYRYDLAGQPVALTVYPTPGGAGQTYTLRRDPDGVATELYDETRARTLVGFGWNDAGALRRATDLHGGKEEFTYDADGPVRTHTVELGGTVWHEVTERDASGRPTLVTTTDSGFSTLGTAMLGFGYDGLGRISSTAGSFADGSVISSYYEGIDHDRTRIAGMYSTVPGHADRNLTYRYAGADPAQLTKIERADGGLQYQAGYNGFGALRTRHGEAYILDPGDRVREDASAYYAYGADGARTHAYDKTSGEVVATLGGLWEVSYTPSGAGFARVGAHVQLGTARIDVGTGATSFVHRDYQGSAALARGAIGDAATRRAFTPYGEPVFASGPGASWLGFQGGVRSNTGGPLLRFGARDYDPMVKLWTSQDPVIGNPAYGFNFDNPAAMIDPTGLDPEVYCTNCKGVDMVFSLDRPAGPTLPMPRRSMDDYHPIPRPGHGATGPFGEHDWLETAIPVAMVAVPVVYTLVRAPAAVGRVSTWAANLLEGTPAAPRVVSWIAQNSAARDSLFGFGQQFIAARAGGRDLAPSTGLGVWGAVTGVIGGRAAGWLYAPARFGWDATRTFANNMGRFMITQPAWFGWGLAVGYGNSVIAGTPFGVETVNAAGRTVGLGSAAYGWNRMLNSPEGATVFPGGYQNGNYRGFNTLINQGIGFGLRLLLRP